ncbi:helix-turn-helix transcriptional regulator [Roseateles violae]|uniref:YafY family protein n=1 Tax=Roseateles violae TaxID=3058042 RepID=A0ABT8DUZ3_9BURK|nr:YafY family protein [Pelomonas sp. PFR6]MDN3922105.1 YafY family protein [Pelomonas sp. PFR6]
MEKPTSRVLAVLELLQSNARLPGAELARRLGVEPRTVRRYIAHLIELGVPVDAQRGRDGGYALTAGHKLPPMMFTSDEALALAMGLRAARELGLNGILPAIASTQAKLERVMPQPLRRRIGDVNEVVALDLRRPSGAQPPNASAELLGLSAAARAQQRVRLGYLDASQSASARDVDIYGLAYRGGAWYAVGHCHLRRAVRSFRLDRVQSVEALPISFGRPPGFDVLAYLTESIATLPRSHAVEAILHCDLATARRALYAEMGLLDPCAEGVRLCAQADDLESMARDFSRLPFGFSIVKPAALRRALASHAQALLARSRG